MDFSIIKDKMFNIAGPCNEKEHYMLPALERLPDVVGVLRRRQYFVIHAARQSGKTTAIKYLADEVNKSGQMRALYCSLEAVQEISEHDGAARAIAAITLTRSAEAGLVSYSPAEIETIKMSVDGSMVIGRALELVAGADATPLAVFFDEADCMSDTVLISFLRQLRDGYVRRDKQPFPSSIALVGMRRIQDYKAKVRDDRETLGTASPFNITSVALTLRNFTREEVAALYGQHTAETGQKFEDGVYDEVMKFSGGQPWLVNALANECVDKIHHLNYSELITVDDVRTAKETIIRRRDTHMLSLLAKLEEERVMRIVEAVVTGGKCDVELDSPDCEYVLDIGILKVENGTLVPSNQMYAEMIARYLSWNMQNHFINTVEEMPWVKDDGLDMNWLVREFQGFWREQASSWRELKRYKEAGPHIIFMAFLQRVVNGGGNVIREMALGSYKLDIGLTFRGSSYAIELKLKRNFKREKAIGQTCKYIDLMGVKEGWLLVFDKLPKRTSEWKKRLTWEDVNVDDKVVHIVGF